MEIIHEREATDKIHGWLSSRGKSALTIKAYKGDVRMFYQEMDLEGFTLPQLEVLAAEWLNKGRKVLAPKTTIRRLTTMRGLARSYGLQILQEYSTPTVPRAKPHPLPNGAADLDLMFNHAGNHQQRALLAFTGLCGLRISEARNVAPADINVQDRLLTVRGKGDVTRIVPISNKAWAFLMVALTEAFISKQPTVINYSDRHARHVISLIAERAGIPVHVASHDLRGTFGSEAFRKSLNIRAVQELLGHKNVEQTVLYTGVRLSEMREAAEF